MLSGIRRKQEGKLLRSLVFCFLLGFSLTSLGAAQKISWNDLQYPFFMLLGFYGLHLIWECSHFQGDELILPLMAFLSGLSLIMIYRLKPELMLSQFIWIMAGLVLLLVLTLIRNDYKIFERYKYIFAFLAITLLLLTVIFGTEVAGNKAWLGVGFFRFQPAELVKILLVFFLAGFLQERKEMLQTMHLKYFGPLLFMLGVSLLLVVFQKDLGLALLLFGVFLAMLYAATSKISYVFLGLSLFLAGFTCAYYLFAHVAVRVDTWLDPWKTVYGTGYQITQALFALGSGGLFGTGLGLGFPYLIPAVHTDFVFVALAEELGYVGAALLLLLYFLLVYRCFKAALSSDDEYTLLLLTGLGSVFALQTIVIIGGTIKTIPLTGITLPFISYGGSSIIANFLMMSIFLNASHHQKKE